MSIPFQRTNLEQSVIRKIFSRSRSIPAQFQSLVTPAIESTLRSRYEMSQLLICLESSIGSKASLVLCQRNLITTLVTTEAILSDFLRPSHSDKKKDLQLTLVCNLITEIIKTTPVPTAAVDGNADKLLRECGFDDSDFKLLVRQRLFDHALIDAPFIQIYHYE